jgi:phage gp29-like protein
MVAIKSYFKKLFGGGGEALEEQQTNEENNNHSAVGQLKREFAEHPSKGLTPARLYQILEEAEQGELKSQSELFEDMEEKDSQIGADMAKRRQLAAELEWQIVPPDNATAQEKRAADHAAEVFSAMEVEDLILDLGTGLGHGWSNLELPWGKDGGLRFIEQPQLRPHSWFRLHPDDQNKIMLRDNSATGAELWPLGWVEHRHRAKPGYVARMGLHRMLVWPYLFQNYALGDLAQLLEIYGLPTRIGKYPSGATKKEKATLLNAVVRMGKDAAGIIPQGMQIDFLEAAGKGASADVYKLMMDWCERSKAKVILGGTLTSGTGEGTNTNALGNVHERGQMSLIRSDVRQYAGSIKKHILWPMAALNFGIDSPQRAPRFYLDTGETEELEKLADTLPVFVDMGMRIPSWWAHEKSGIPKAGDKDEVLLPAASKPSGQDVAALEAHAATTAIAAATTETPVPSPPDQMLARTRENLKPATNAWINQVRELADQVDSLDALREALLDRYPEMTLDQFADALADAMATAHLAGRNEVTEENPDALG